MKQEEEKLTRDECLGAISGAFNGAKVWAVVGFWNVNIETEPKREIFLSDWFVSRNINKNGMLPEELKEIVQAIPDEDWFVGKNGSLHVCYKFPSGLSSSQRDVAKSD